MPTATTTVATAAPARTAGVKVRPVDSRQATVPMTAAAHTASTKRTIGRAESEPLPSPWSIAMGQHR